MAFCQVCMWVALRTLCKVCFKEKLSFPLISDSPRFIPHVTWGPSTESVYCLVSHSCGQIPTEKQHKEGSVYFGFSEMGYGLPWWKVMGQECWVDGHVASQDRKQSVGEKESQAVQAFP